MLAELPWPTGPLDDAVDALRAGDVDRCAALVAQAYALDDPVLDELAGWWAATAPRPTPTPIPTSGAFGAFGQ